MSGIIIITTRGLSNTARSASLTREKAAPQNLGWVLGPSGITWGGKFLHVSEVLAMCMRNFSFVCHVGAEIPKMESPEPPLGVTLGGGPKWCRWIPRIGFPISGQW